MLVITVELLHGTYRADPSGLAHTGRLTAAEWPPAPLRLLAALIAADGTRDRCRHTSGEELAFLEAAPPPVIDASPSSEVHHQALNGRFVVEQAHKAVSKHHHEYLGRQGVLVRPGVRASPRSPRVVFLWDLEPPDAVLAGLRLRAARVGYLGAADSPVSVRVGTSVPDHLHHDCYRPDPEGGVVVGVPRPGVVAAMDAHYDRWREEGASVQRSQSPGLRRLARYRAPGEASAEPAPEPTLIGALLGAPISGRRVTAVTAAFKAAVLDHYQRAIGEPPAVLHGHVGGPRAPHTLAYFLALPDVGHPHARGLVHGLALLLPAGTDPMVVEGCRAAMHNIPELDGPGFSKRPLRLWSGERQPRAANPERWRRPSRWFATVFPALHERRGVDLSLAEITRWCRHANLPDPIDARSNRGPLVPGAVDLHPAEVNRPGRPPRPYSHVALAFAEPVRGPVVIGAGRQRGLGLCVPLDEAPR